MFDNQVIISGYLYKHIFTKETIKEAMNTDHVTLKRFVFTYPSNYTQLCYTYSHIRYVSINQSDQTNPNYYQNYRAFFLKNIYIFKQNKNLEK